MFALVALIAQSIETNLGLESFLPTSVLGWLGILTTVGLVIDRVWNRGKKEGVSEETINGIGLRVKAVESNHERLEGQFIEHQRTVDRVLVANENLLKEIGRAERASMTAREDSEKFTIDIGSKVDALRRDVLAEVGDARREFSAQAGAMEVALGKLETEVRLRAEFEARERNQE